MVALDPGAAKDATHEPGRGRRLVGRVAQFVMLSVAAATGIAAAGRVHWAADLATHFPWQYAAAALAAAAAFAWARRPVWALASLALFAVNVHTARTTAPSVPDATGTQPLRLVSSNVFWGNDDHERVIAFIRAAKPDVVVLTEVTPAWRDALRVLEDELPHAAAARPRRHGVLVLSRWPLQEARTITLAPGGDELVRARVAIRARSVELVAAHAAWPLGPKSSSVRNLELANLARLSRSVSGPLIVAGDLNVSAHSPHFADLLAAGALRSAAGGRGWTPTWPTFFLPAGIQIDHVLISDGIGVVRFATGPAVGSDHLPVVADLML